MTNNDNKEFKEPIIENNETNAPEGLYYIENGLMVFTEKFHLRRGYCCTNGCRHCPYRGKQKVSPSK
ncbi:MAG: hypothetical protein KBF93_02195 [Leptospiraceae bacterium]|nr:hypothetical protein [Leptospiraceae bacterium]